MSVEVDQFFAFTDMCKSTNTFLSFKVWSKAMRSPTKKLQQTTSCMIVLALRMAAFH